LHYYSIICYGRSKKGKKGQIMSPACRTEGHPSSIPTFGNEKRDVQDFIEELAGFHNEFKECFCRSEPRL
jgi:hypothetical protein